ncbi:PREDICTED: signal peptidase complex subunit 1 isoform X1 [Gekko japonicus]|uniref:Signal peptidase complex subunit 1 n=2 Tax=Gekko japonicus TaxID=146911 RepID=A0ABM1L2Z9_GEKJA|nr:PREDICTED: signal peptidase complex subunit 1 isoform X1 [Gekko japonicus]
MRRGKKTSVPASSVVVPALRSRPATRKPEAPANTSPVRSSAAGGANSLRDPFQAARPESKPSSARLHGPLSDSDSAPAVGSETSEAQESPPPPPIQNSVESGRCVQAARPESKPSSARLHGPLPDSDSAPPVGSEISEAPESPPAVGPETNETEESPPPPPPIQNSVESGQCARGLALELDKMFNIFQSIPTQMDYKGQKLAEQIFQGIILVSAVIGFIYGYITEQFGWTVYIVMAGFALSCLLTLPPWPIYRRNPLKWLPVQEPATDDKKPADRKVKRHSKN